MIERGRDQVYVHFLNKDKRLDDWVPESLTRPVAEGEQIEIESDLPIRGHKRKRSVGSCTSTPDDTTHQERVTNNGLDTEDPFVNGGAGNTSEEDDIAEHQLLTRRRNFDMVNFGDWQMKTWYVSLSTPKDILLCL